MGFWRLDHPDTNPALIDGATGQGMTYGGLRRRVDAWAGRLGASRKPLVFLLADNSADAVAAYLSALTAGAAVALLSAGVPPDLLASLIAAYRPDRIAGSAIPALGGDYEDQDGLGTLTLLARRRPPEGPDPHPDLALVLPTSGTTGSRKFVRLSHRNLRANAGAIAAYLALTPAERPITTLPMAYSYGLSVINSHLLAGGTLLLTGDSPMQRPFWDLMRDGRATSLAGVPYTYRMLARLGLDRRELPALRTLTQAGGALEQPLAARFAAMADARGWRFFVMYGQTEATARIAYVPPERLKDKIGAIGIPIPGGALSLDPETQELIYQGPNVMMGYAEGRDDLARGDELGGCLRTGDLATVDGDGFYRLTGRLKRFVKLFGLRINLDDVERDLAADGGAALACVGDDTGIRVVVEGAGPASPALAARLAERYRLHPSVVSVDSIASMPRLDSGKVDYAALSAGRS